MFDVLGNSILPVFSIIFLGYFLRLKKIILPEFIKPANQIVFYVAIPAILFNAITQTSFRENFDITAGFCLVAALIIIVMTGLTLTRILRIPEKRRGTFLQSCFHGNIGYMAYAIAFYALGEGHFARTAILSSFLLVGQNFMAIWALTASNPEAGFKQGRWTIFRHSLQNPIIVAVLAGIVFSAAGIPVPKALRQLLTILSGMAVPTALLLIGASLSFGTFRTMPKELAGIGLLKLVCLPLVGYALMRLAQVPGPLLLPGIVLLAAPPATVTYVMTIELGGNPELAAASISVLTLLSALTYSFYISMLMG